MSHPGKQTDEGRPQPVVGVREASERKDGVQAAAAAVLSPQKGTQVSLAGA